MTQTSPSTIELPMRERLKLEVHEARHYVAQVERVRITSVEKEPFLATHGFEMNLIIDNWFMGQWVDTCATDGVSMIDR